MSDQPWDEPAKPEAPAPAFPVGSRLAGAGLLLASIALLATMILDASHAVIPRAAAGAMAVVDLVSGVLLLAGVRVARMPSLAWVVLGALLIMGFGVASSSVLLVCIGFAIQGGIVLMLAGTPRALRISGGVVLVGMSTVTALGTITVVAAKSWIKDTTMEEIPNGIVHGKKSAYRLVVPRDGGWLRLKDSFARRQNAEADLWLTQPTKGMNVIVIAEDVEEGAFTADALADAIVKGATPRYSRYDEIARAPLPGRKRALVLHARGIYQGDRIEELVGIFLDGEIAYQIHAIAPERGFAGVKGELDAILRSFEPPRELPPKEFPPAPLTLVEPIPPDPWVDGRDVRKLPPRFLSSKAHAAVATRDYAAAVTFEHWAVIGGGGSQYDLACYHARAKELDSAFYWLQRAAAEQGVDVGWASKDDDLAAIRADHRWAEVRRYLSIARRYWAASGKAETLLVLPKGYKKGNAIPAVVGLHGFGSTPQDFSGEDYQPIADALGVAFVSASGTVPLGPNRYKWAELVDDDRARIHAALRSVEDRLTVQEGRVVLMGFSQGGQMAAEIAARHPDAYAGAIVMSPGTATKLALDDVERRGGLGDRRFVIVVGSEEHATTVETAAVDAQRLRAARAEVLHKAYEGMRTHSFPPDYGEALPIWVRFILGEQKKP